MTADNLEDGLDAIVAEFVLGTLTGEERDAFEERLATSSSLQASVAEWENRLSGMYDLVPESEPPPALWSRIDDTLGDAAAQAPEVQDDGLIDALTRGIRMWRWTAAVAAAATVVLAAYIGADFIRPNGAATQLPAFAILQPERPTSSWFVRVMEGGRHALISPISAPARAGGRDFELWAITGPNTAPLSLGVIQERRTTVLEIPASLRGRVTGGVTLAISVEPAGGSPTGAPTGPVVFTGKLASEGGGEPGSRR